MKTMKKKITNIFLFFLQGQWEREKINTNPAVVLDRVRRGLMWRWSYNREDLTDLSAPELWRASSCAADCSRWESQRRKKESVPVERWGLLSVTEIIVLQRILEGKVAGETVWDGVAVIRADDRVHLSLPSTAHRHNRLQLELWEVSLSGTTNGILFFYSLGWK